MRPCQPGLQFNRWLYRALKSWHSCLSRATVTGLCHHTRLVFNISYTWISTILDNLLFSPSIYLMFRFISNRTREKKALGSGSTEDIKTEPCCWHLWQCTVMSGCRLGSLSSFSEMASSFSATYTGHLSLSGFTLSAISSVSSLFCVFKFLLPTPYITSFRKK